MITKKAENKGGRRPTHGHSSIDGHKKVSKTYNSWKMMKERCMNPKNNSYPRYGGRGISVCPGWLRFEGFLTDMGERPQGLTLDRIDVDKGYSPENCRWATLNEQQNNRKDTKTLTANGETLSLPKWCKKLKINRYIVHTRIRRGWSLEKAILTPIVPKKR